MSYWLGIDLGTTYTAAAVWRDGRAQVVDLGTRAPVVPSVVLLRDDGELIVGEAAERRAATEPERVAREFKRRIGDPTPVLLAGTPVSADALTARLLRWTVDKVAESEGGPAAGIAVSHPANWRDFKQDLLRQVIRQADLDDARTLSEPEAAAIHYASQERVAPGSVVAVYDLGGGTFDATVLRQADDGWSILGEPEGIERLGGIDFDEAVFQHVVASLGDAFTDLDPVDPAATAAVARLRRECVAAKEALASDTDASVPVVLPSVHTEVRITRSEFEDMIQPSLAQSVAALRRALRAAHVEADDVHAVLLVGGSSRIPLVAELVSAELGRPIALDAHPKYGVALGAAMTAAGADRLATGAATSGKGTATAGGATGLAAAGIAATGGATPAGEDGGVRGRNSADAETAGRSSAEAETPGPSPTAAATGGPHAAAEMAGRPGPRGAADRPDPGVMAGWRSGPGQATGPPDPVGAGERSDPGDTAGRSDGGGAVAGLRSGAADDDPTEPIWAIAADDGEPPPGEPAPLRPRGGGGRARDDDGNGRAAQRRPRALVGALAAAAVLVVGSGVAMALRGGGGGGDDGGGSPRGATRTTTTLVEPSTTSPPPTDQSGDPPPTTSDPGRSQAPTTVPPTTEAPTTTAPETTTTSSTSTTTTTTTTTPEEEPVVPADESAAPTGGEEAAAPGG